MLLLLASVCQWAVEEPPRSDARPSLDTPSDTPLENQVIGAARRHGPLLDADASEAASSLVARGAPGANDASMSGAAGPLAGLALAVDVAPSGNASDSAHALAVHPGLDGAGDPVALEPEGPSRRLASLRDRIEGWERQLPSVQERLAAEQAALVEAHARLAAARHADGDEAALARARAETERVGRRVARLNEKQAELLAALSLAEPDAATASTKVSIEDVLPGPTLTVHSDGIDTLLYVWTPIAGASGYTLYLSLEPGVSPATAQPFGTTATAMLIDNVPPVTFVYAVVTATVDGEPTRPSNEVRIKTPTALDPPTGLAAHAQGGSSIVVTWDGVAGADGYRLYWSDAPGVQPGTSQVVASTSTAYTHSGLQPGETYYYRVASVNGVGVGAMGPEVSATTNGGGEPQGNEGSPLGVNLHAITYWSPEWVFKDVFKQSKPWYPQEANTSAWDTGHDLTLTADGYPILGTNPNGNPEAAGTLMLRDLDGHYPAGEYICLYDGQGEIEFGMDAVEVSSQPGRIVVRVDSPSNGGIFLKITSTPNPSNPVRNIRLFQSQWEGSYQSEPFHPAFLERLAPFGMIRFMDWQRTNHNTFLKDWSDRATPSFQTQGSPERGVALEHMIDLSNTLGADPWFCMPHLATDDFVEQFAIMCRDRLDPDLKVYVEHSNEVWNGAFVQAQYALQKGEARGLGDGFQAQLRYHSERSVEIFEIFEDVFGGTERLVRVLGSQSDNPWVGTTVMDWNDAHEHADALTVAPYWDGDLSGNLGVINMSMNQIMDILREDVEDTRAVTQQNFANAQARGLDLIAYEGGQHLTPKPQYVDNQAMADKLIEINRHPGMYDLYVQDLENWAEVGGGTYAIFSSMSIYSKWGSWGIMEYEDQDKATAPKYQACLHVIAEAAGAD